MPERDVRFGTNFPNHVLPFRVENGWVRGRLVRLGACVQPIITAQPYPAPVGVILGETLALAAALASALKYEGNFKLQAQGDGPVSILVADLTSSGGLRGYARYREEAFEGDQLVDGDPISNRSDLVPRLLGGGYLAFTVDQGPDTEQYQGITALEGASLAECAHAYFRHSEQLETAIMVTANVDCGDREARAAALMIQRMPGDKPPEMPDEEAEEAWRNAVVLMSSMTAGELLDAETPSRDILYRLYHEEGIRVYRTRPIQFQCRCSRDKVALTLAQFGIAELADMKTDEGAVVVTCEFCQSAYTFGDSEIADLTSA